MGNIPPADMPMKKHMHRFHLNAGIVPQIPVLMNISEASKIEPLRPNRSAKIPQMNGADCRANHREKGEQRGFRSADAIFAAQSRQDETESGGLHHIYHKSDAHDRDQLPVRPAQLCIVHRAQLEFCTGIFNFSMPDWKQPINRRGNPDGNQHHAEAHRF